jgi:single-stranded DNA-binding protein
MWINVELWDDEARSKRPALRKGAPLAGLGTLIFNKWLDKNTGEERKQFKLRMFKVLSSEAISEILEVTGQHEFVPGGEEEGEEEEAVFVNDPSMEWMNTGAPWQPPAAGRQQQQRQQEVSDDIDSSAMWGSPSPSSNKRAAASAPAGRASAGNVNSKRGSVYRNSGSGSGSGSVSEEEEEEDGFEPIIPF